MNTKDLEAVIFDMDGLLLDSEPCWQKAEQVVFKDLGFELTHEMCLQTTGMPVPDVIKYWYERFPWPHFDLPQTEAKLQQKAYEVIMEEASLMPYLKETLQFFKRKGLKIGLASASVLPLIEGVLDKFELRDYFDAHHSASLELKSKPDPAVYLTVASRLGVAIKNTLILEDSGTGVKGAKASGAKVIAVPAAFEYEEPKFDIADIKIPHLGELRPLFD